MCMVGITGGEMTERNEWHGMLKLIFGNCYEITMQGNRIHCARNYILGKYKYIYGCPLSVYRIQIKSGRLIQVYILIWHSWGSELGSCPTPYIAEILSMWSPRPAAAANSSSLFVISVLEVPGERLGTFVLPSCPGD